jgi:small subunit ribosomal protein S6
MLELKVETLIRPYESVIIVHPDATEEDQKALFKRNQSIIKSFKGEISNIDFWGKRKLANPIDKHQRAYYFHTLFTATPDAIAELERTMGINDKVLRFMHTRLEDGTDLSKFLENFHKSIQEVAEREREREAKFQAKRAARVRRDAPPPSAEGGKPASRGPSDSTH